MPKWVDGEPSDYNLPLDRIRSRGVCVVKNKGCYSLDLNGMAKAYVFLAGACSKVTGGTLQEIPELWLLLLPLLLGCCQMNRFHMMYYVGKTQSNVAYDHRLKHLKP